MKPLLLAASLCVLPTLASADAHLGKVATAEMAGVDGKKHGTVTLTQMNGAVLLEARLTGIPEGGHGFHIHEIGNCDPDFSEAGGHFNPADADHGFAGDGPHAGDMANVFATAEGSVTADVINHRVSLDASSEASLFDSDGSAIILHANTDTYGKEAGADDRIACGVITD